MSEPALLVLGALFCPLMLWWALRHGRDWPPERKVASPRARAWYHRALLAFALAMNAAVVLSSARYFDLVSEPSATAVGAALAIPFFAGAVPLICYRLKHGM
jgi:hypothetical protein